MCGVRWKQFPKGAVLGLCLEGCTWQEIIEVEENINELVWVMGTEVPYNSRRAERWEMEQIKDQESAGRIDWFMNIKHVPDNLKNIYLVEASYSKTWPTVGCEKILPALFTRGIWCLLSSLSVGATVAGLETLCIKSSSCTEWYFCISLIGRGRFIISRCTPSTIRRHRSLGVTKISDDSQAGCYRLWHIDLTLPWLRNKHCILKNCTCDCVRVTFEPFVCNVGFIGFLWTFVCNSRLNSCSVNDQIFI